MSVVEKYFVTIFILLSPPLVFSFLLTVGLMQSFGFIESIIMLWKHFALRQHTNTCRYFIPRNANALFKPNMLLEIEKYFYGFLYVKKSVMRGRECVPRSVYQQGRGTSSVRGQRCCWLLLQICSTAESAQALLSQKPKHLFNLRHVLTLLWHGLLTEGDVFVFLSVLLHEVMLRKHFSTKIEILFPSLPSHKGVRCRHAVPKLVLCFCSSYTFSEEGTLGVPASKRPSACSCGFLVWAARAGASGLLGACQPLVGK